MPLVRPLLVLFVATVAPFACAKRTDDTPKVSATNTASTGGASAGTAGDPATDPKMMSQQAASGLSAAKARLDSGGTSPSASESASASASASTLSSASASASAPTGLAAQLLGGWVFSKFDESDPATKERWSKVPADMQRDILAEAPKATLEITKDQLITHLAGVPDKKTTYAIDPPDGSVLTELVLKTLDEGRKSIRFPDSDTMRVEDLDKKNSFVTFFVRKKGPIPAPFAGTSPTAAPSLSVTVLPMPKKK